jgi:hypothetical protein
MEMGFVALAVVVSAILGIVVGIIIGKRTMIRKSSQGIIYVGIGDQEYAPSLFLSATVPIEDIAACDRAVFDVRVLR